MYKGLVIYEQRGERENPSQTNGFSEKKGLIYISDLSLEKIFSRLKSHDLAAPLYRVSPKM